MHGLTFPSEGLIFIRYQCPSDKDQIRQRVWLWGPLNSGNEPATQNVLATDLMAGGGGGRNLISAIVPACPLAVCPKSSIMEMAWGRSATGNVYHGGKVKQEISSE